MSLPADYHAHTPLCRHATGEPAELAAQAVRLGLRELGFADHAPMPRDDFDDWRMRAVDLERYVAGVQSARRGYPNLAIKLGLEVDYLPGQEDWIRDLAGRHPWDYFIGSVHYVSDDWAIDNPAEIARWKTREPLEVWTAYFERLTLAELEKFSSVPTLTDAQKKAISDLTEQVKEAIKVRSAAPPQ